MLIILPFLLAASLPAQTRDEAQAPRVQAVARVSVEIIEAKRLNIKESFAAARANKGSTDRQHRIRNNVPMIEFY